VNGINNRPGRLQKIPSATKQNLLTKKLGLPVTTAKKRQRERYQDCAEQDFLEIHFTHRLIRASQFQQKKYGRNQIAETR
jgi:hypothetical protein